MAAIITEKFRIHNARQFKEDFGEAASSTFLFIGRPQPWDASDTTPTPANSVGETVDAYNCLLYTSPSPRDATLSRMPSSA